MGKYDPNTKYGWEAETKFELSGNEFGLILNTFRTVLQSPEAQRVLIINEANKAIEAVLGRNVEAGTVVPSTLEAEPKANKPPMQVVAKKDIK